MDKSFTPDKNKYAEKTIYVAERLGELLTFGYLNGRCYATHQSPLPSSYEQAKRNAIEMVGNTFNLIEAKGEEFFKKRHEMRPRDFPDNPESGKYEVISLDSWPEGFTT